MCHILIVKFEHFERLRRMMQFNTNRSFKSITKLLVLCWSVLSTIIIGRYKPATNIFFLKKTNPYNKFNYPTANCIRKKPFRTRHVKSSMRQFLSLYKVCCALVMITLSVVLSLASEFKFKKKFKLDPLNGTSYRMSLFTRVHKITLINNAHT